MYTIYTVTVVAASGLAMTFYCVSAAHLTAMANDQHINDLIVETFRSFAPPHGGR